MNQEQTQSKNDQPQWDKEFEEFGQDAVNRAKELVEEGKVRRLVISRDNETVLDVPLLPAVAVGAVMTFWMPYMTLLAVAVAFVAKVKLEIVHTETVSDNTENVEITS